MIAVHDDGDVAGALRTGILLVGACDAGRVVERRPYFSHDIREPSIVE
jgi:hypothetical protein